MNLQEFKTAQALSRELNCDPRTAVKKMTPVAKVRMGSKIVLLYKAE
jgi:hypothetical protein